MDGWIILLSGRWMDVIVVGDRVHDPDMYVVYNNIKMDVMSVILIRFQASRTASYVVQCTLAYSFVCLVARIYIYVCIVYNIKFQKFHGSCYIYIYI